MGKLISPHYLTSAFPKLLEKNGLRRIRFHDLRHPNVKPKTKSFQLFLNFFKAALYAPTWGIFLLFKYLTEHSGYAQIHFAAVGRMDANIEITEQIPVLQGPVQIPAQAGEIADQQNVNVPIHRLIILLPN